MKRHNDIKNEIEAHIHGCATKMLASMGEECRSILKAWPPEITAGIHLAALHIVQDVVMYAAGAVRGGPPDAQATEPYSDKIGAFKKTADAFNAVFAGPVPVLVSPLDVGEIPSKKQNRKGAPEAGAKERQVPVITSMPASAELHHVSEA